ncbi:hypothetical protein [Streptantibioticus ferralitis]|uniref:Uncharacterized protein n=1 Tax=Streptantibioticus ferralitis TaxID=236510 RepID=A0ABT5YZ86_9ACTN|nr:hypothetical protein [Streptantibioticus ferralitis]MDF2256850.1 hypothetical protein [Streptantibioticus ferralitis]
MLQEPRSGRMTAWGNALLGGFVAPDDAAEEIVGGDSVHRIVDLPGEEGPVGLTLGLGRLRALGVSGFRLALPVPGHPLGLSGPPEFNTRALAAGEAVIGAGAAALGLVPEVTEAGPRDDRHVEVLWRCLEVWDAPPADVPSLGEAERELAEALRDATAALSRLDVAGAGPAAQAALDAYRARVERGREVLAPGYPPRAARVLELAQRVGALTSIAQSIQAGPEHGTAVSASQIAARAELLRPVERTARRAQVAAYNAYVEEAQRRKGE